MSDTPTRHVTIEQSPEYVAIARRRIAETVPPLFAGQTPGLFAETGGGR